MVKRHLIFDMSATFLRILYYCFYLLMKDSVFQVTNQMVTACKNFLTDRGVNRVWDQPRQPLIQKLKACLKLNQEYQKCFQRTKKRIAEDPSKKPFEFSEMYIFGKFDTFCKRLNQVWMSVRIFNAFSFSFPFACFL